MKILCSLSLLLVGILFPAPARTQSGLAAGAEAAPNATWTDAATGLMWSKMDNGSDVDWNQATAYCSNLKLEGNSGWRLPTIEELQGLYDRGANVETTYDFGIVHVAVKGKLKLSGWDWSSSRGDKPEWSQTFGFSGENRGAFPLRFSYNMRALCVRPSGEDVLAAQQH